MSAGVGLGTRGKEPAGCSLIWGITSGVDCSSNKCRGLGMWSGGTSASSRYVVWNMHWRPCGCGWMGGGCRVLRSMTVKGAYGNVTEELFVLTLLLCSAVPAW